MVMKDEQWRCVISYGGLYQVIHVVQRKVRNHIEVSP